MGDFMGISRDVLTTYTWWLVPISICVLDVSRLMIRISMMSQYITGHSLTISDVDMCKDLHQLGRPIINSHWIRWSHHFIASNSPIIDVKVYKTLVYHQLEVLFVGRPSQIQNKNCGFRYPLALSAKIPISLPSWSQCPLKKTAIDGWGWYVPDLFSFRQDPHREKKANSTGT